MRVERPMPQIVITAALYAGAALAEIGGCFAFWAWLRNGKPMWLVAPGVVALLCFAYLLTLAPSEYAGRAFAAYGGVYIAASLMWLWWVEGHQPDRWDLIGGLFALTGAAIILFAPRSIF